MDWYELKDAFEDIGLDPELGALKPSQRPDLCDFVCNGALAAAGKMRMKPIDLANQIVSSIDAGPDYKIEVAGNGFINVTLTQHAVEKLIQHHITRHAWRQQTVVMDFGGPNVAKPMHVGHLRSLVIGDSLCLIANHLGYEVLRDIHMGDWGLQMGMLLAYNSQPKTIAELLADYKDASLRAKHDPSFLADAQGHTVALQSNDASSVRQWKTYLDLTLASVRSDLDRLGIMFDLWNGESNTLAHIPSTLAKLGDKVRDSDGALVIGDDPPLVLQNSSGGWLYGMTDLATILMRKAYKPVEIVYVVDERQSLHFKQVFEAAKPALTSAKLTHVGFGTVNGPDGKPFKTRMGENPLLHDLIMEAERKAATRSKDPHTAHCIAMAALKFSDLQTKRTTSYSFDLDRAMGHEGHTGVYLLYAVTRIHSVFAKAKVPASAPILDTEQKRRLGLLLANYDQAVLNAWNAKMPHFICEHLLAVASQFSAFYAQENITSNGSNLALALKVQQQLIHGLGLLGIETVKSM